jgi:hypothetical protein
MRQLLRNTNFTFILGAVLVFIVVQALISLGVLNAYWQGIIFWGAAITMVSLGLNLIYASTGSSPWDSLASTPSGPTPPPTSPSAGSALTLPPWWW